MSMLKLNKYASVFFVFLLLMAGNSLALVEITEEEMKAKFITNYIAYLNWPKKVKTITVCFLNGDITSEYIKKIDKKLEVRTKNKNDGFDNCEILYLNKDYIENVEYITHLTKGLPVFTISDSPNFVKKGGIASFYIQENKEVVLELNINNLNSAKIKVDSDLLSIMKIVKN